MTKEAIRTRRYGDAEIRIQKTSSDRNALYHWTVIFDDGKLVTGDVSRRREIDALFHAENVIDAR